jgi:hypothetical protein
MPLRPEPRRRRKPNLDMAAFRLILRPPAFYNTPDVEGLLCSISVAVKRYCT